MTTTAPRITWTLGSPDFNVLMSDALSASIAYALGDNEALAHFDAAFVVMEALGVFGVPSEARRDLLRAGEIHAAGVVR